MESDGKMVETDLYVESINYSPDFGIEYKVKNRLYDEDVCYVREIFWPKDWIFRCT